MDYGINDVALMTGLSDRTLREYIKNGVLVGDKVEGAWRFSEEQISAFFEDKQVYKSIKAKKNALCYDFLLGDKKKNPESCFISDIPCDKKRAEEISEYFCSAMSKTEEKGIDFSFSYKNGTARIILKGGEKAVFGILSGFYGE